MIQSLRLSACLEQYSSSDRAFEGVTIDDVLSFVIRFLLLPAAYYG